MPEATLPMLSGLIRDAAHPLTHAAADYDALLAFIGDARFVLLGEASHGTHEFYRERVRITKRLILEKGFTAVAVEADWPDAYRVNRYVQGQSTDADSVEALSGFRRFPAWMWRNADVLDFVGWLRAHNDSLAAEKRKTGFYGLDLYSLHTSIEAVLAYLDKVDPEGARRARHRYACFENFGEDPQTYGYAAGLGLSHSCEEEVIATLLELQRRAAEYARRDGRIAADDFFYAEQNALLVKDAEEYYRTMFRGRVSSWNLRDSHMAQSLDGLIAHLSRGGCPRNFAMRLAVIAVLLLSACLAWGGEQKYAVKGMVIRVDAAHKTLDVSCQAIPGYMEAMLMPFTVRDAKELEGLVPGAMIQFTVVVGDESRCV